MSSAAHAHPRGTAIDRSPAPPINGFQKELAVYNANLIDLMAYVGRSVVICGEEIRGPYDTPEQARQAGRARYGATPFLVKQIRGYPAFGLREAM